LLQVILHFKSVFAMLLFIVVVVSLFFPEYGDVH
jgi:hypothetical protein